MHVLHVPVHVYFTPVLILRILFLKTKLRLTDIIDSEANHG